MNQKAKVNQKRKGSRPQGGNQGRSGSGGNRNRRPPRYGKPAPASRGNRTWWIWGGVAVVFLVAILVAVAASGGDDGAKPTAHETGAVTVDGTPLPQYDSDAEVDTAIGDPIPTLSGVTFDGSKVTIGPTGKPQVVIFLAHWCPHCQAEVPRIVDLAKQGAFEGIDVAAVATGTSTEAPNYPPSAWLEREEWPFPVMVDSLSGTAAQAYGLSSYPYFVFVDAEGNVAGRASGEIAPSDLQKILSALEAGNLLPKGSGASSSA